VELVRKTGKVFVVTHNYTGYPMVRQARAMVANGDLARSGSFGPNTCRTG
jgi:predicted dehydrogenase